MTVHTIEINKLRVAYRLEKCPFVEDGTAEEDHQCESDCTWMEGDRRELDSGSTYTASWEELDDDEWINHDNAVEWAVWYIRKHHPEVVNAPQMTDGKALAREWIDGETEDPYKGDLDVDTTTVYLTGDWTDADRGSVFKQATGA